MRPRSAKSKGRKLQNEARALILAAFPELDPTEVKCALMSEAGEDLKLTGTARKRFPFAVECRNREHLNFWQAIKDAERHAAKTGLAPLTIVSRNRMLMPYVALPFDVFLTLLQLKRRDAEPPTTSGDTGSKDFPS